MRRGEQGVKESWREEVYEVTWEDSVKMLVVFRMYWGKACPGNCRDLRSTVSLGCPPL